MGSDHETADNQLIVMGEMTAQASKAQASTLHRGVNINSLQQLAAAQAASQPASPNLPIAAGQSIDSPPEPVERIDKMQQAVRRSKRIAEKKRRPMRKIK